MKVNEYAAFVSELECRVYPLKVTFEAEVDCFIREIINIKITIKS